MTSFLRRLDARVRTFALDGCDRPVLRSPSASAHGDATAFVTLGGECFRHMICYNESNPSHPNNAPISSGGRHYAAHCTTEALQLR